MRERRAATYNLHGLRVRSEVDLPAPVLEANECDLEVRWGRHSATSDGRLQGRIVAGLTFESGAGYVLTRTAAGWRLRFHTVGEFRFDAALRRVRIHLAPGADRSIVPLLLAGNVTAFVLGLTGRCILHASAVEIAGDGIGFLGASSMGKSTLAALCCSGGARLITDDVLRLESTEGGFRCVRGPAQIRLREGGATLTDRFPPGAGRITADRRLAVRVEGAAHDDVRLRLLAIPCPSRDSRTIVVERLGRVEALYALTRYARILGWRSADMIAQQFARCGAIAAKVPVYQVTIPWGPPFPAGLGTELIEHLSGLTCAECPA